MSAIECAPPAGESPMTERSSVSATSGQSPQSARRPSRASAFASEAPSAFQAQRELDMVRYANQRLANEIVGAWPTPRIPVPRGI